MKQLILEDTTLSYRDQGEGAGDPLVLLHAFPLSGAMWQAQVATFAKGRRVIVPDLRGFGASQPGTARVTLDRYADDVAQVLDQLKLERVVLAGLSMGGYIAFSFLRRYPERLAGLILADTRPQPDTPEAQQTRELNAQLAEGQGVAALAEKLLPGLLAPGASAAVRARVRELIAANTPAGVAAALRAMASRVDSVPLLATITVPTLVLVGSEDALTPPAVAREMAATIPNSQYAELPGAGHLSNLEAPEAFTTAVAGFLQR